MKKIIFFLLTLFLVITGCNDEVGFEWDELEFPVKAECIDGHGEVDPFFQEVRKTSRFVVKADTNFTVATVKFDSLVISPGSYQMFGMTEIYLCPTSDTVIITRPSDLSSETAIPVTYYHRLHFYLKEVTNNK